MFPSRQITALSGDKFRDEWSLAFDGSDDHIDCGNDFETTVWTAPFSISVWVKLTDATPDSYNYICGIKQGNDYIFIRVSPLGQLDLIYKDGTTETINVETTALTDDTWHHIVGTVSDSYQGLYLDGALVDARTYTPTTANFHLNTSRNLFIGGRNTTGSLQAPMEGSISDFALYSTALSAGQIKDLYNEREPYNHMEGVAASNVVAWYRMGDGLEEGKGTTVYDMSPNTFNGTMTDMAPTFDYTGNTP